MPFFQIATANNTEPVEVLPEGGTTGEVLKKASNADNDVEWAGPRIYVGDTEPNAADYDVWIETS